MESCIVCLECCEDISSRISTLSSEWIDGKMQRIIEKHLWWWYLKPTSRNNLFVRWICRPCWQEISSFHHFYDKVEKVHKYHHLNMSFMKINSDEPEMPNIKLEANEKVEYRNTELVLFKDLSKVVPQKREENKYKFVEKAVDIRDVKTEFCFNSNESPSENSEDMCVYPSQDLEDSDTNCNEMQSEENNPLIHKFNITEKRKKKVLQGRKNIEKEMKSKEIKLKENSNFDHFFKETEHKLECCICNVLLSDFRSLKAHYRIEHSTQGYAMCCGKKFFKRCLLVDHLRAHIDPNLFKCQLCSKTFGTRYVLEMHLETHKIRERKYNCDECGKSYFKVHVFERHKLTHVSESEKHFSCSHCSKKFASDNMRRYHEDSTHARKYVKICDICGKSLHHSHSFLRHMKEHAGVLQSMQTCDICDAKLTSKKDLRQHIKKNHLEENQEQICPYCSRVSPNRNAHRMHVKYSHTLQRKHACCLCDKAFRRPLELKEHLSTHTGEVLYTCDHCPRTFISNANMYKHRRNAHSKEWEESRLRKLKNIGGKTVSADVGITTDKQQ